MEYHTLHQDQFVKPLDDYLRVATDSPEVAIADIPANINNILARYKAAHDGGVELLVLPELCLTGYSAADLFHNQHVLEQTEQGLTELAAATVQGPAMIVGTPLPHKGLLYNCAAVLAEGRITGIVPKSYLPNYKEFYERRWFASGKNIKGENINIIGSETPFGTDLLFDINRTKVGVEICEDAWAPIPPSSYAALAGAEVIVNLSASNELIGKASYRRQLISDLAARLLCGYVYTSAGQGESVADVIYGGHQIIAEPQGISKERLPHAKEHGPLVYDIDRTYIAHNRFVNTTWAEQAAEARTARTYRTITIKTDKPDDERLLRTINPEPFVPSDSPELQRRCEEIFSYMSMALAQRIKEKDTQAIIIGLSGGLDSTLALLTAVHACDLLGVPYDYIHTLAMPAKASSERTQDNAGMLAGALGTTHKIIPIENFAQQMLGVIGHDKTTEDIAYENTQARIRTTLLMNYANRMYGLVQGTGDMSENALGWCTFNGDHMSMYNPNTSIPKTLVRHLVQWYADHLANKRTKEVLLDILDTPISPELTGHGQISQTTEDIIGPYELNDFFLYHNLRYASRPAKIGYLATAAFNDRYRPDVIAEWLNNFLARHTASQWKRDVMPNGPKIGSVSLSPRGDLRMAPNTSINWWK